MIKKFELDLSSKIMAWGMELFRIRALISFGDVKKGDLGGYVEKEENLSHSGDAWVTGDARVFGDAEVFGDAWVHGNAKVSGNAKVYGEARVCGDAVVSGNAKVFGDAWVSGNAKVSKLNDYIVFKNSWSSGRYFTYTRSNKMWRVGCFYGTGEELVEKAYQDSENSGKHYEAYVNLVKTLEKLEK